MTSMQWTHGQKTELAKRAGVPISYLSDILYRRKPASKDSAARLEEEALKMGLVLTRLDLLYPLETQNPLFGPLPETD